MPDDVLSSAREEPGGGGRSVLSAAAPTAPHAGGPAAKPCGTSTSRSAGADIAATERIAHSSPAGHTKFFSEPALGDGPRTASKPVPRWPPAPLPAAAGLAPDTGNSAGGGTAGLLPSSATSDWPANAATARPPAGTAGRSTAIADTEAERTARSPSTDTGGVSAPGKSLASEKNFDHLQEDPRELIAPIGQVPERISAPLRDAFTHRLILGRPPY